MASVNKVVLIGNVGKDPELKYLQTGAAKVSFSLATTESYKKNDQWENKTEWHNIVMFNKQAEYAEKYIKKGNMVYLEGKISNRSWEDDQGNKKYMTEINCHIIKSLTKKEEQSNNKDAEDDLPWN